jgi:hypothetical protein
VSHSNQEMMQMVQQTLTATHEIAAIAQATEAKASVTREQVEAMDNLSRTLLQMVEFFHVSAGNTSEPIPTLSFPVTSVATPKLVLAGT